jgi:hypothetical protein
VSLFIYEKCLHCGSDFVGVVTDHDAVEHYNFKCGYQLAAWRGANPIYGQQIVYSRVELICPSVLIKDRSMWNADKKL